MSTRVLATDQAKQTIQQFQSLVNGSLADSIRKLNQLGQTLSDPNVWDGPLAREFRGQVWPQANQANNKMLEELGKLRSEIQKITTNIMVAGGGQ
jgi:uncharacterized protein YukE